MLHAVAEGSKQTRTATYFEERPLVAKEGKELEYFRDVSLDSCKGFCMDNPECRSLAFKAADGACYLKDKNVTNDDESSTRADAGEYKTHYLVARPFYAARRLVADEGNKIGDRYGARTFGPPPARTFGPPPARTF